MPDTTLTIRHDYEGGTTVEGTEKNSPAHHAIKANRSWTWSRYAGAWLLRSSRHRRPKYAAIDLIEQILTDRGYTVTRDIDETMPTVEEQEANLAERMDDRSNRLNERSEKQAGDAAATRAKADAVFENIPFGQPMLVGHHSYKADRKRRERAANNLTKSIRKGEYADELARRSDTAAAHMSARHNPVTVGNRIEKLDADRRAVQRRLNGDGAIESYTDELGNPRERRVKRPPEGEVRERLTAEADDLDEQLAYWRGIYAELQAEGKASTAGPGTVAKGDWVLIRGYWYRARRVNKKSVSVPSHLVNAPEQARREWTDTAPWHEVREHRATEQMPAAFVNAYETPGTDRFRISSAQFVEAVAHQSAHDGGHDSAG